jgi:hypothetical protein
MRNLAVKAKVPPHLERRRPVLQAFLAIGISVCWQELFMEGQKLESCMAAHGAMCESWRRW